MDDGGFGAWQQEQKLKQVEAALAFIAEEYAELEAENERLKGAIPAYEPPPCECCRKFTDYYAAECDCGNLGDHEAAVRWCVRMEIADAFQGVIDAAMEGGE